MYRQILLIIIFLFINKAHMIYSEEYIGNWPDEIRYFLVEKYIEEKSYISISKTQLKLEYEYILDFLRYAKLSHEANCENYFYRNSLIQWLPAYKEGEFFIRAIKKTVLSWDDKKREYISSPDIAIVLEIENILDILYTYNELIEFWHERTGEILREKYDMILEIKKLNNFSVKRAD
jgi:hypothetical protein